MCYLPFFFENIEDDSIAEANIDRAFKKCSRAASIKNEKKKGLYYKKQKAKIAMKLWVQYYFHFQLLQVFENDEIFLGSHGNSFPWGCWKLMVLNVILRTFFMDKLKVAF